MRESDVSARVMVALRGDPNILAFKHADRYTSGIPDISATGYGNTTWLETKNLPKSWKLWQFIKTERSGLLQLQNMRRLAKGGRAWYLVYREGGCEVWHPEFVFQDFQREEERQVLTVLHGSPLNGEHLFRNLIQQRFEPFRIMREIYQIGNFLVQIPERIIL